MSLDNLSTQTRLNAKGARQTFSGLLRQGHLSSLTQFHLIYMVVQWYSKLKRPATERRLCMALHGFAWLCASNFEWLCMASTTCQEVQAL